jgi:hypothetical protein
MAKLCVTCGGFRTKGGRTVARIAWLTQTLVPTFLVGLALVNTGSSQTPPGPSEAEKAALAFSSSLPKNCTFHEPDSTPGLHLYPPFTINDNIFTAYCKLQALAPGKQIGVYLINSPQQVGPLMHPEGQPYPLFGATNADRQSFAHELVKSLYRAALAQDAKFWQSTPTLAAMGMPETTEHAEYAMYNGFLVLELRDVEIMGINFDFFVRFLDESGAIAERFQHASTPLNYLELTLPQPNETLRRRSDAHRNPVLTRASALVGFPFNLITVELYSEDKRLPIAGPAIVQAITQKYPGFVKGTNGPVPNPTSQFLGKLAGRRTDISDGKIQIAITQGKNAGNGADTFLIKYAAVRGGPLDVFTPGQDAFNKFAKSAHAKQDQGIVDATKKSNSF